VLTESGGLRSAHSHVKQSGPAHSPYSLSAATLADYGRNPAVGTLALSGGVWTNGS
jgi:hypothetical protein